MVANCVRVLTSGMGLFLATTTTTTTFLVRPAYGYSSASTADVSEECAAERVACNDDATCFACVVVENSIVDGELTACTGDDGVVSSVSSCDDFVDFFCCVDQVSDEDCLGNDNYVDYIMCDLEFAGCSVGEITCDEDGDSATSSSNDDDTGSSSDDSGSSGDDSRSSSDDDGGPTNASSGGTSTATVGHASIAAVACALFMAFLPPS